MEAVIRKVTAIGHSLGVTLPPEMAHAYGLEKGVLAHITPTRDGIVVTPAKVVSALQPEGARRVKEIINRYRPALDAMAKGERKIRHR